MQLLPLGGHPSWYGEAATRGHTVTDDSVLSPRADARGSNRRGQTSRASSGNSQANDEGTMWPTSFALKGMTAADEERIATLVTKAVG